MILARSDLHSDYSALLASAEVRPSWEARINAAARKIIKGRARYERVANKTGVPWAFIGVLHHRESGCDFKTHLHNGDPLTARTYHVPDGRPLDGAPPFTWEESALDAIQMKQFPSNEEDWEDMERVCYEAERYNGFGYRLRQTGVNSPYLWSGTDNYTRGKFYADRKFSPSVVDQQVGVIPVYLRIKEILGVSATRQESRKLRLLDRVVLGVKTLLTTITGVFTLDTWGIMQTWFGITVIPWQVLLTAAVAGVALWVLAHWLTALMLEDADKNRWIPSGRNTDTTAP